MTTPKTTTALAPNISTLDLSLGDRAIGGLLQMQIDEPVTPGSLDLAGDAFFKLLQGNPYRDQVPPQRAVNQALLKWAESTPAWDAMTQHTRNNIASSLLSAQMLHATMQTDEVMGEALKQQDEAEMANKIAQQKEREAKAAEAAGRPNAEQARRMADEFRARANQQLEQAQANAEAVQANPLNRAAMGKAVREAGQEAERVSQIFSGWGHGPGSPMVRDAKGALAFMKKITPKTERIARFAGRMRGVGINARRQRVTTGDTPAALTYTDDLQRVLATELAQLSPLAPRLLRMRKLAEFANQGGLLGRRTDGIMNEAGAFVFAGDVSGSMNGTREEQSKGVALGLAQIAALDDRPYHLFSFSSHHDQFIACASTDPWPAHLNWAEMTIAGGTDFDVALLEIMRLLTEMGDAGHNADAVIGSDGEGGVSTEVAELWRTFAQATGARLLYIPVAQGYGSIDDLADLVIPVDEAFTDEIMRQASTWMR